MRYLNHLSMMALVAFLAGSCKKSTVDGSPLASLNVTNAVVGGKTVKLNSNLVDSATNYNFKAFGLNPGNTNVYVYPTGDSTHPYYNHTVQTGTGGVYSLFLAGNVATQVDTILLREFIPVHTDSSCGVRFINLSYNSNPISVTLSTTPTMSETGSLAYKQNSVFKTYPALSTNGTYSLQVRDVATNNVLATYSLTTPRFFNCTLVWKGMTGGTGANAPGVLRVNNY